MPQLLNQFHLKPGVTLPDFQAAWDRFAKQLLESDLASTVTPIFHRVPDSGYDTDTARSHDLMSVIAFRDQAQADAAWDAIEHEKAPVFPLHQSVIRLVHDPVFTFWQER